jgi:DNA-binding FadR family transcriptional regulator
VAAERATAEDLTEMKVSMDALAACVHDPDEFTAADVEFHRVICKLTHNPLYVMVLDSIGEVLLEIRRATVYIPKRLPELLKVHRQIYDAIALHDVEGAQAAMRDHLEELDRAWRKLSRPVGRLVKK